jgi:hypothetical protein
MNWNNTELHDADNSRHNNNTSLTKHNFMNSTVDIVILYFPKNEKELAPNVAATFLPSGDLDFSKLITTLKDDGFPIENCHISYYCPILDIYINCGKDPLPRKIIMRAHSIASETGRKMITLKIKLPDFAQNQEEKLEIASNDDLEDFQNETATQNSDSCDLTRLGRRKKHRERKIGEVIDLIYQWRTIHLQEVENRAKMGTQFSLENAAMKLGVSKKSLDDYLLMIKHAKSYCFDFQKHHQENFGYLRSFVKMHKTGNKKDLDLGRTPARRDESIVDEEEEGDSDSLENR